MWQCSTCTFEDCRVYSRGHSRLWGNGILVDFVVVVVAAAATAAAAAFGFVIAIPS